MSKVLTVLFDDQLFDRRGSAVIGCGLFVAMLLVAARTSVSSTIHAASGRLGRVMIRPAFGGI